MKSPNATPAALSLLAVMPKSDKPAEKNQDSAHYDVATGRFAVADGATRMLFSELFSRSLTQRFCDSSDAISRSLFATQDWRAWLQPSCDAWRTATPAQIAAVRGLTNTTLTNRWNAGQHGGATFAGIEISAGNARESFRWQAMVIGDCCLIHLDAKGNWLVSHPLQSSKDFDSWPQMFVSGAEDDLPAPAFLSGTAARGDAFILASDTIAKWLMQQNESGNWALAFSWLTELNDAQAFADHIDRLRSGPPVVMDDDDITLMLVKVAPVKPVVPRVLMPATVPPHETVVQKDGVDKLPPESQSDVVDPVMSPAQRLVADVKEIARDGWHVVRPHLTRRRVLPAITIALLLVAVLLAVRSLSTSNDPYRVTATSAAGQPFVTAIVPVGAPVSPLRMPTATKLLPTATPFVPTITPSPTARPTNSPTPTALPSAAPNLIQKIFGVFSGQSQP